MSPTSLLRFSIACSLLLVSCRETPKGPGPSGKQGRSVQVERVLLAPEPRKEESQGDEYPIINETEPNDHPTWAHELPPRTVVRGYVNKPRKYEGKTYPDRDVYLFTVPGPKKKVIWARLKGVPGIDTYIEVYRRKGPVRIFAQNGAGPGGDEIIPNLTLPPGQYFFKLGERWVSGVFHHDLRHPYEFVWMMREVTPGMEAEPNDARYQANQLVAGRATAGVIGSPKDRDVYRLPSGPVIRLDLSLPKGLGAVLSLWPEKGKRHTWRTVIRPGSSFTIRRLAVTPSMAFAVISAWHGGYDLHHKYRLKVALEPRTGVYETEPNDTAESANPITPGTLRGYISHPRDVDHYRLTVSQPSLVTLRLQIPEGRNYRLTMGRFHRAGTGVVEIHKRFVPKGTIPLSIEGGGQWDAEHPYTLSVEMEKAGRGAEREPNDTRSQAMPIHVGEPVRGYITPKKDVDYYVFVLRGTISDPPVVEIRLTGTVGANPILRLIDAWGNVVREDSSGVYTGMRKITSPLHPGLRYYIEVRDRDGLHESPDVPYELRLEKRRASTLPYR